MWNQTSSLVNNALKSRKHTVYQQNVACIDHYGMIGTNTFQRYCIQLLTQES